MDIDLSFAEYIRANIFEYEFDLAVNTGVYEERELTTDDDMLTPLSTLPVLNNLFPELYLNNGIFIFNELSQTWSLWTPDMQDIVQLGRLTREQLDEVISQHPTAKFISYNGVNHYRKMVRNP